MYAGFHAIGVDGVVKPPLQRGGRNSRIEIKRLRPLPKTFQVAVEKRNDALVQPQALPDAVAQYKTTVEYRYHGLLAREQFSVDVNLNVPISLIRSCAVSACGHGIPPFPAIRYRGGSA